METAGNFGQRMTQYKRENGLPHTRNSGRKPIAEKYRPQIAAVERAFAENAPSLANAYVDEVKARDPEECPDHHAVLTCPECGHPSQRKFFDHRSAQYVFDRIMGKPTTRSENAITVTVVQQLVLAVAAAFGEVNGITDPAARQVAFAERCAQLGVLYAGAAA